VASLVAWLKRLGYRTVAVHPYPASFYRRDRVYRQMGFDEFLDLRAFAGARRCGPYVSDEAVTERVASAIAAASGPTFVYTITMENHGPLHLESVTAADVAALYSTPPPAGCDDLTVYLRHLRNADRMLAALRATLAGSGRPASLCWFGDHVPSMPRVFKRLKAPVRDVEYLVWNNWQPVGAQVRALHAHELALAWLQAAGVARTVAVPGGSCSTTT
jgi:phosphoglycerol transferase MdoB-like AlkP superfamily enzyme